MTLICAACGEPGDADPCVACGGAILLVGRYQLVEVLGRGRSGVTFRALRVSDGANVAIKEMPLRGAANDKARALYQREARVLQQLSHPRIPRHVEDFVAGRGKDAGIFLVEELVEGRDLGRELEERRYDEAEVLDVLRGLLPILVYLHGRSPPVMHRDIKPRNVMRRPDGELVLLDFGAVRDATDRRVHPQRRTEERGAHGLPRHPAREQRRAVLRFHPSAEQRVEVAPGKEGGEGHRRS